MLNVALSGEPIRQGVAHGLWPTWPRLGLVGYPCVQRGELLRRQAHVHWRRINARPASR